MKLILALLLTFITNFAYSETTGNLLPNVNDGVDWGSNTTDMINDGSSGYVSNGSVVNGFTITCPDAQANCGYKYDVGGDFEVTGTATLSANDIKLYSNTITQPMLDNGITLNSYVDVANCESTEGNCESKGGANDSHTTIVILKDSNGSVLSTSTQTRTDITGFQGNCNGYPSSTSGTITNACGQYNDSITYLGIGSNNVDWSWSGTDSNYTNQSIQGPNLLGASLNMTYNSILLDENIQENINDIVIDDSFIDEIIIDQIITDFETIQFEEVFIELEELNFEEVFILDVLPEIEDIGFEEIIFEEFEDITLEDLEEINFDEFEEIDLEEFEEIIAEAELEEFDTVEELDDVEVAEEKTTVIEEEKIEVTEEKTEEITNDTLEEETKTEKAEGILEEDIESEKIDEIEEIENEEIEVVSKDLKIDINDNINIQVEEITLFSNNNALEVYTKNDFYKPQQIYSDVDNALFIQTDLGFYYGNIYTGITLDNYISTDPISQHNQKLYDLKVNKLKIMIELKKLKGLL